MRAYNTGIIPLMVVLLTRANHPLHPRDLHLPTVNSHLEHHHQLQDSHGAHRHQRLQVRLVSVLSSLLRPAHPSINVPQYHQLRQGRRFRWFAGQQNLPSLLKRHG